MIGRMIPAGVAAILTSLIMPTTSAMAAQVGQFATPSFGGRAIFRPMARSTPAWSRVDRWRPHARQPSPAVQPMSRPDGRTMPYADRFELLAPRHDAAPHRAKSIDHIRKAFRPQGRDANAVSTRGPSDARSMALNQFRPTPRRPKPRYEQLARSQRADVGQYHLRTPADYAPVPRYGQRYYW